MRRLTELVVVAALTFCRAAAAQESAPASRPVDRSIVKVEGPAGEVELGAPFPLVVERAWPAAEQAPEWKNAVLTPLVLEARGADLRQEGDRTIERRRFEARAFAREAVEIPEAGLRIAVKSVLPDPPGPVEAPPGPLERPFDWGWFLGALGALLTALAAVAFLVRWLRRRPVFAPPPPPPIPPWDRALARLEALRGRAVNTEAEVQAYYVEVSSIVRDYLEDRFRVRAPEMTTEEFLAAASTEQLLTEAHRLLLSQFLLHCDLVKFAHGRSTSGDRAGLIAAAERFVQETRIAAEDLTRSTEASAEEKVRA